MMDYDVDDSYYDDQLVLNVPHHLDDNNFDNYYAAVDVVVVGVVELNFVLTSYPTMLLNQMVENPSILCLAVLDNTLLLLVAVLMENLKYTNRRTVLSIDRL